MCVKAALSPNRTIDARSLLCRRGDWRRGGTGKFSHLESRVKSRQWNRKKLYVDYGDRVKQGELLAELDKVQLEAASALSRELAAAEAALIFEASSNEQSRRGGRTFVSETHGTPQQMFKMLLSKTLSRNAEKISDGFETNRERAAQSGLSRGNPRRGQIRRPKLPWNAQEDLAQFTIVQRSKLCFRAT